MANTYTLIASNTLGASAASVTFSAIPATFTDLVLRTSVRDGQANANSQVKLTINGLATTINSRTSIYADSATPGSSRTSNAADLRWFYTDGDNATADTFSNGEIYIPSYTASQNKPLSSVSFAENNATNPNMGIIAGLIRETGAITSITLVPNTAVDFLTGSSFFLYGISNS